MRDYKQYNYPSEYYAGEPFPRSGCGPCSVADLVEISPIDVANWLTLNGYAYYKQGTKWEGINKALDYYGFNGIMVACGTLGKKDLPEFEIFKNQIKKGFCGILLMGNYYSSYWTGGGHYISIVEHDINTDKYLVYDSASVDRTDWHSWNEFNGDIKCAYTSSKIWKKGTTSYMFEFKECKLGDHNNYVLLVQEILKARGIYTGELDSWFGEATKAAVVYYQTIRGLRVDGVAGQQTIGDMLGF